LTCPRAWTKIPIRGTLAIDPDPDHQAIPS
jgi:hypothetical protein